MMRIIFGLSFDDIKNMENFSEVRKIAEEEIRRKHREGEEFSIFSSSLYYNENASDEEWIRRNIKENGGYLEEKTYSLFLEDLYNMAPEKIRRCEELLGCPCQVYSPYHNKHDYREIYQPSFAGSEITALLKERGVSDFMITSRKTEEIILYFGLQGLKRGWAVVPPRLLDDISDFAGIFPQECGVVAQLRDGKVVMPEDLFERDYDVPFLEGRYPKKLFVSLKDLIGNMIEEAWYREHKDAFDLDLNGCSDIDELSYSEEVFFYGFERWKKRYGSPEPEDKIVIPEWESGLKERYERAFGKVRHAIWGVLNAEKYTEEEQRFLEEHFEGWQNEFGGFTSEEIVEYLDKSFVGYELLKAIIERKF